MVSFSNGLTISTYNFQSTVITSFAKFSAKTSFAMTFNHGTFGVIFLYKYLRFDTVKTNMDSEIEKRALCQQCYLLFFKSIISSFIFLLHFSFSVKTVCETDIIIIFILRFQRSYQNSFCFFISLFFLLFFSFPSFVNLFIYSDGQIA